MLLVIAPVPDHTEAPSLHEFVTVPQTLSFVRLYRFRLLHDSEGHPTLRLWAPSAGSHGHGSVWLPDWQHGQTPLRDVSDVRQRHLPSAPGPWPRLREAFPGRAVDLGASATVLSHETVHPLHPTQVSSVIVVRSRVGTCIWTCRNVRSNPAGYNPHPSYFFLQLLYPFRIFISFRHLRYEAVIYSRLCLQLVQCWTRCVKITAVQNDIICTHMG